MNDAGCFDDFLGRIIFDNAGNPDVAACAELSENLCDTFTGLSLLLDTDIDDFIKLNKERNCNAAHPNEFHDKVFIHLKAVLFELKDQSQCGIEPTQALLDSISGQELIILRSNRNNALRNVIARKAQNVPNATVLALTQTNWRDFKTSVLHSLGRIY